MISERTRILLTLSKLPGIGRRTLVQLARDRLLFELPLDSLHEEFPELRDFRPKSTVWRQAAERAERDIDEATKRKHWIVSVADARYPKLLAQTSDRPALVFGAGSLGNLSSRSIGIIGTREPSEHGIKAAIKITTYFAKQNFQIVSGLALGIDTIAHATTVVNSARTVAVLGHGLDRIYPKENQRLGAEILESGGLLLSEYPYHSRIFPSNFIERDRIQAGLSLGIIMVQSDEKGGSWHASRAALQYGRHLLIAKPTDYDVAAGHPKVNGAVKVISGSPDEVATFLRCPVPSLSRVHIVRGREDYEELTQILLQEPSGTETTAPA